MPSRSALTLLIPALLAAPAAAQDALQFSLTTSLHAGAVLATGDVDGDGRTDIATSGSAIPGTVIATGQGDGTFANLALLPNNASMLALGDVAGTPDADLLLADPIGSLSLYLGDGAGGFVLADSLPILSGGQYLGSHELALGDLDGDGVVDVAAATGQDTTTAFVLSDAAGQLTLADTVTLGGLYVHLVTLGDLDGDGDLDAIAGGASTELAVLENDGSADFSHVADLSDFLTIGQGVYGFDVELGDMDTDGDLDVVFTGIGPNHVSIMPGQGDLTFTPYVHHPVGADPDQLVLDDLDGDGDLDVLTSSRTTARVMVAHGDGAGALTPSTAWFVSDADALLAAADLAGDGRTDAVLLHRFNGRLDALDNDGTGPWRVQGAAIPQSQDLPAVLTGQGPLTGGSPNLLDLAFADEGNSSFLVIGLTALDAPFQGGVMVPNPDVVLAGLPIDGEGNGQLPFVIPAGTPVGTQLWVQHWWPLVPGVFFSSNGLRLTVQ